MSYRLDLDDRVGAAVAGTALERIDHAILQLRETAVEDRATAVHDARKDLKKLRSLLRLIAPGVGRAERQRENTALAEIGRSLSGARDADVMIEVVDDLSERAVGRVPVTTFTALRAHLADAVQDADGATDDAALERAAAELDAARGRLAAWPLEELDDAALIGGLERAYRRGRAALAAVDDDPADERLHDWRKRVKDLWYQQRLLRDAWAPVLHAQAGVLDELAELLGDDHDLAVLRALLIAGEGGAGQTAADLEPVVAAVDARRRVLQDLARSIGHRVYAEKPAAFARRHARYLAAARADREAAVAAA